MPEQYDVIVVGGLFYHSYPGGSGLSSGMVFGRLAGTSAAQDAGRHGDEGLRLADGGQMVTLQERVNPVKSAPGDSTPLR